MCSPYKLIVCHLALSICGISRIHRSTPVARRLVSGGWMSLVGNGATAIDIHSTLHCPLSAVRCPLLCF